VTPQPRKRPRSSYRRFEAAQPNECWQSDFTHWALADGTDVEILNWLDDHSRLLLACTAHRRVTGPIVVSAFLAVIAAHGAPAATLTDNGSAAYLGQTLRPHNLAACCPAMRPMTAPAVRPEPLG
jgi:transposase InsO family protein